MSSLVLVSRIEDVGDASAPSSTRASRRSMSAGTLIYPNLGEPIARSASSELPFYFALYGPLEGVKAHAQLLRNGQALAEAPIELRQRTARASSTSAGSPSAPFRRAHTSCASA